MAERRNGPGRRPGQGLQRSGASDASRGRIIEEDSSESRPHSAMNHGAPAAATIRSGCCGSTMQGSQIGVAAQHRPLDGRIAQAKNRSRRNPSLLPAFLGRSGIRSGVEKRSFRFGVAQFGHYCRPDTPLSLSRDNCVELETSVLTSQPGARTMTSFRTPCQTASILNDPSSGRRICSHCRWNRPSLTSKRSAKSVSTESSTSQVAG